MAGRRLRSIDNPAPPRWKAIYVKDDILLKLKKLKYEYEVNMQVLADYLLRWILEDEERLHEILARMPRA